MPLIQTEAEREFVDQMLAKRRFTAPLSKSMGLEDVGAGAFGVVMRSAAFKQGGVLKVFIKNTSDDDVRREAAILLLLEFHKVSGVPKLLEWTTTLEGDEGGRKQAILIEDGGRRNLQDLDVRRDCDETTCTSIFMKMYTTLLQMRAIGFSNNDVSLSNIVTSAEVLSASAKVMLVDFGTTDRADKPGGRIPITRAFKPEFLDPHVLLGHLEALYGLERLHMKGEHCGWQTDMYGLGVVVARLQGWDVDPIVGVTRQQGMEGNELFEVVSSAMALKVQDRLTPEQFERTAMFKRYRAHERTLRERERRKDVLLGAGGAGRAEPKSCGPAVPRRRRKQILTAEVKAELMTMGNSDSDSDGKHFHSGHPGQMPRSKHGKGAWLGKGRSHGKGPSVCEREGEDEEEMPNARETFDGRVGRAMTMATASSALGSGRGITGSGSRRKVTHPAAAQFMAGARVGATINARSMSSAGGGGNHRDERTDAFTNADVGARAVKEEMVEAPAPVIHSQRSERSRQAAHNMYPFYGESSTMAAADRYGSRSSSGSFPSRAWKKVPMDSSAAAKDDRDASVSGKSVPRMVRPIAGTEDTKVATGTTAAAVQGEDVGSTMRDALSDRVGAAVAARPLSSVTAHRPFERRSVPVTEKVPATVVPMAAAEGKRSPRVPLTDAADDTATVAGATAATGPLSSAAVQEQCEKRNIPVKEGTSEKATTAANTAAPVEAAAIATATGSEKWISGVPTVPGEAGAAETVPAEGQEDSRASAEGGASSSREGGGSRNQPEVEASPTAGRGVRRSRRIAAMASVKAEVAATAACATQAPSAIAAVLGEKTRKRSARRGATTSAGSAGDMPPVPTGTLKRARVEGSSSNGKKRRKRGGAVGGVTDGTSKQTTRKVKRENMVGEEMDASGQECETSATGKGESTEPVPNVGVKEEATSRKRKAVDGGGGSSRRQASKRRRSPSPSPS